MRWPSDKPWNVPTIHMFGVGCLFLVAAAWSIRSTIDFQSHAIHVCGLISSPHAHPRIRFTTLDGTVAEFQTHVGGEAVLGDSVPVVYLPEDPEGTARADSVWAIWPEPLGFAWIGLGFTLLPAFGMRAEFRGGRW